MTIKTAFLAGAAFLASASAAQAEITWNWQFGTEAGTLITSGDLVNGVAAAGTYDLIDFATTQSGSGSTIGSISGGQYAMQGWSTLPPYSLAWDGSEVSGWLSAGANTFDWWVFRDTAVTSRYFFFGADADNENRADWASLYDSWDGYIVSGQLSVAPLTGATAVPEPASWAMMIAGLGLVGGAMRRKRARTPTRTGIRYA